MENWSMSTAPNTAAPNPGHGLTRGLVVALVLISALISLTTAIAAGAGVRWVVAHHAVAAATQEAPAGSPIQPVPQSGAATGGAIDAQAVAAKVTPAVVDINVIVSGGSAAGTGMILTSGGEVLTNNHVVEGATSIKVTVGGGTGSYTAHVLGTDPVADVALIQLEGASGLSTVALADSSTVVVGEPVVAIGNRLGQGGAPAVTSGSVTDLGVSITAQTRPGSAEQLSSLIQTDASISPGDSGGPLVNSAGQVIGMITAGSSQGRRQSSTTEGFAITSNAALAVVNQVRSGQSSGTVSVGQPGYIGVQAQDLTAARAARLGLDVSSGALIVSVVAGSPAEAAGIAQGSVITAINGTAVDSVTKLGALIKVHKPGDRIQVTWLDQGGGRHTATLTLTSGPAA